MFMTVRKLSNKEHRNTHNEHMIILKRKSKKKSHTKKNKYESKSLASN